MGGKKKKSKKNISETVCETKQNVDEINRSLQENEKYTEVLEKETIERPHEDDSASESEKPKKAKKKRKKQPEPSDEPTNKKNKKSIRQMKREKFAQRQAETQTLDQKDQLKSQCLNYLSQWKHDKQNWKFMKAKQVWLYKNKFSAQLVPDASWPVLLEYFESAQGNIKTMLLNDANKIIKQMDEWTESNSKEATDEENQEVTKPDENIYNRARSLIQCLEE